MPYRRYITAAVLMALAFLAGTLYNQQNVNGHSETSKRRILYYHDPMHPSYRSDKPGVAPDCGMQLQPVYVDTPEKGLHINAEKQQLIGIKVGHVETTPAPQSIRSAGRVAVDETRLYRLNAATDGWIHETQSNSVGSLVRKDQSLVTYYTRELRSAVQAYFYVLDRMQAPETPSGTVDAGLDRRGLELALEGLRNLGMSDSQIQEIGKSRTTPQYVVLRSPATGFVVGRNVSPLQRFSHGDELYRIADLSRVWILVDLFENDTPFVHPHAPARVLLHSGQIIRAKVSETLPQFDGVSRTSKVRIEVDNPTFVLKPDMFVDVEFLITLPAALTVPADAVVDSGRIKTVFIDEGGGYFEPRTVETGWRFGDRVQIVRGLTAGEKIVVSGNFLMDSEVRMRNIVAGTVSPR